LVLKYLAKFLNTGGARSTLFQSGWFYSFVITMMSGCLKII